MATIPATIFYSSKFPDLKYRKLGKTGFTTSVCGFGCYRVDDSVPEHHQALTFAIENGINLIDTSSNYSFGGSEKLVGNVFEKLISEDRIIREDIIIISKGGYLQGPNLDKAKERENNGNTYQEVVKCSPDLWHCIHPDFLKDQIDESLKRLQLDKIDIYLLHNPEYFLTYSDISSVEEKQKEFYRRIKTAFEFLESEVSAGRISFYGISSNTLGEPADKNNFVSLEKVNSIANDISKENHFAVAQLPMNLIETGAYINKNQRDGSKTVLEFAKENDIGILINRPLNAISNNKIIRLADFEIKEDRSREEIKELIGKISKTENILIDKYVNKMNKDFGEKKSLLECLSLGKTLDENYDKFESPNHFNDIKGFYLIPRANFALSEIGKKFEEDDEVADLLNSYAVTVNITLDSIESDLARDWNIGNKERHSKLNKFLDDELHGFNLAQKAIMFLNSVNEISCTLVGMRKQKYVSDVIDAIRAREEDSLIKYWDNLKSG